jgi:hypothetical protein
MTNLCTADIDRVDGPRHPRPLPSLGCDRHAGERLAARGPLTRRVLARLASLSGTPISDSTRPDAGPDARAADGWSDDLHLALFLCHELHCSGLPGVPDDAEWDPDLLALRRQLEDRFESALRRAVPPSTVEVPVDQALLAALASDDGPSISRHMEHAGTIEQMREFVIHRSAYQLEEGDHHTFAIPRLRGAGKRSLARIQAGEYGADGDGREIHATLFAQTMRALGLDDRRHAYLDRLPASALAVSNLISLFGLNRRWRGALVGHLAAFELTSVEPMGRYSRALDRLGAPSEARRFFDVHVLADAEHEIWAMEMAQQVAATEPALVDDIVFGARCALEVERRFAEDLFHRWGLDTG